MLLINKKDRTFSLGKHTPHNHDTVIKTPKLLRPTRKLSFDDWCANYQNQIDFIISAYESQLYQAVNMADSFNVILNVSRFRELLTKKLYNTSISRFKV